MPSGACVVAYRGKRGTVWRIKYADADGRQVMETLGPERDGWTERKAQAELRERLVKVERRGWRRPTPLTFIEYADTWRVEAQKRRNWKPGTLAVYRPRLERLKAHFGPVPLAAIRPRHVAEYVAEISRVLAPATVNGDVSLLIDLFRTARREELVDSNPAEGAERPKIPRRRWRILEPVEIVRVAKAFTDEQARCAFLTLILTGIRRSELQQLRWGDVDLVEGVLRVRESKTEEGERAIALPPALQEVLWQHRRRSEFQGEDERVFCNPRTGGPYLGKTFKAALEEALASAKVDAELRPFHDLRHASLTNGAAAGESPIALMARAGHADMRTTKRYLHLAGVVFRDEADRLEQRLFGGRSVAGVGTLHKPLEDR
jgi:integrase